MANKEIINRSRSLLSSDDSYQSTRRQIVWIASLTLIVSVVGFFTVLLWSLFSENERLDFQGAAGVATIIPAFAGVILAAWAIYSQIRAGSPSYRAAEKNWLDLSELYQRALKLGALLTTINTNEPEVSSTLDVDAEALLESAPLSTHAESRRLAERFSEKRCAAEFKVDSGTDSETRRTVATLALEVFPVLDSLQQALEASQRIDLVQLESELDVVCVSYDPGADYAEHAAWVAHALATLGKIVDLIERLSEKELLRFETIEAALLQPIHSHVVKGWFDDQRKMEKIRASRRERFGALVNR